MYIHRDTNSNAIDLPLGKIVCVGRNYADHIEELNNAVPDEPLLFIKPATALCSFAEPISIVAGQGECHNELEIAILIKSPLTKASESDIFPAIWGYGLGLDLTLRDVQNRLKEKGLPWERAKSFDNSCPMSDFVAMEQIIDGKNLAFSLSINGELRQQGNTQLMLNNVTKLLVEISQSFTLLPGDIVMTGTPKGVGPLLIGDKVEAKMEHYLHICSTVV